jgi:hypothetical protein
LVFEAGRPEARSDDLVTEEPLEIRLRAAHASNGNGALSFRGSEDHSRGRRTVAVTGFWWKPVYAGPIALGTSTFDELGPKLYALVLDVASGRTQTKNERNGFREIAIWKDGVTL